MEPCERLWSTDCSYDGFRNGNEFLIKRERKSKVAKICHPQQGSPTRKVPNSFVVVFVVTCRKFMTMCTYSDTLGKHLLSVRVTTEKTELVNVLTSIEVAVGEQIYNVDTEQNYGTRFFSCEICLVI